MKTIITRTNIEIAFFSLIAISILLVPLTVHFGNGLFALSTTLTAGIYIIFMFVVFKEWKRGKGLTILKALFYFYFAYVILGVLYELMGWPSPSRETLMELSFKVLYFNLSVTAICFLKKWQDKNRILSELKPYIIRTVIFLFIAVVVKSLN